MTTTYHLDGNNSDEIVEKALQVVNTRSGDRLIHVLVERNCGAEVQAIISALNESHLNSCSPSQVGPRSSNFLNCINVQNNDGKTPLHVAAIEGHLSVVSDLIEGAAKVDVLKRADWTPLMCAVQRGHLPVVEYLLNKGADISLRNKDGWTPFQMACRNGSIQMVHLLMKQSPDVVLTRTNNGRSPLHTAALHGHLSIVKLLTSSIPEFKSDVNSLRDSCGITLLIDAAKGDHLPIVQYLIDEYRADPTASDFSGRNPLHHAALSGANEVMTYLINVIHMDPNVPISQSGQSACHLAAAEGHLTSLELLISCGAQLTLTDRDGYTPLDTAKLFRKSQIVHFLSNQTQMGPIND